MKSLFAVGIAIMMLAGAVTANASVLLYEDFEDDLVDWWKTTDSFWHREDYRSYTGSSSLAYNWGDPWYDYWTPPFANYGVAYSAPIDVSGSGEVYFELASWLETENYWNPGQTSYAFDNAFVQIYDTSMSTLYETLYPDINYFAQNEWVYLYSIDIKPMLDAHGLSQFRMGFSFDTVDGLDNMYEGWYIDDFLVYDDCTTPIPEPSTWMLLGTGLLAAVPIARRKLRR